MQYYKSTHRKSTHKRISTPNTVGVGLAPTLLAPTHVIPTHLASTRPASTPLLRVAFSLFIAGLTLALCIFYSWTILLILSLICAIMTLITIHLLFDEEAHTIDENEHQLQPQNTNATLPRATKQASPSSSIPASLIPSPLADNTQPIHLDPGDTLPFPTTPMPVTPIVRVLETIDLSSTNVEHFLDIHGEWHHPPASQLPENQMQP